MLLGRMRVEVVWRDGRDAMLLLLRQWILACSVALGPLQVIVIRRRRIGRH